MLEGVSETLTRIWQIECYKYKQKGLKNIVLGYFLLYLYFWHVPTFVQSFWPKNIENKMSFQLMTTSFISISTIFIYSLIYIPGYLGVKAYKKYEIEPNLKKPWERDNWDYMKKRTAWNLFVNLCINPFYLWLGMYFFGAKRIRYEGFPTQTEVIKSFIVIFMADDFVYMWLHRIFHEIPALYRYHKVHHEYEAVFCSIGQYAHPVQHIFANLLPSTIVFAFMDVHIFTLFFWQVYKLYISAEGHSGYQFPWSPTRVLPFVYGPSYHDYHHTKNVGNYSASIYLFELIAGTNKSFFDRELAKASIKSD